ncbi:MAG: hypothetical protein ABJO86_00785 [Lentilitoribacter sp.]
MKKEILAAVDEFIALNDMRDEILSGRIFTRNSIIPNMREENSLVSVHSAQKILDYLEANWPENHPFPALIVERVILEKEAVEDA